MVSVRHGEREGLEAFFSILESQPCRFEFNGKPCDIEHNVHTGTTLLLLEPAKHVDESVTLNHGLALVHVPFLVPTRRVELSSRERRADAESVEEQCRHSISWNRGTWR